MATATARLNPVDKHDARRRALADSALLTLGELGYAKSSLREIANNSEFSHGVVHYYFADKFELIIYCVKQYKATCVTRYDGVNPPEWFGLGNFRLSWADPRFQAAVRNSLAYLLLAVPLRVLGALGLALLLRERRRGLAAYRAAVFLPTVVPDVAFG